MIEITDLHKSFGDLEVLKGINLAVKKGEVLSVIGASGSGKSTLLYCINGLEPIQKGSIKVDGEEVIGLRGKDLDRVRRKFGMLFQSAALFDSLPVWENVAFGLVQGQGLDRKEARAIADARLSDVGLKQEVANLYPAELSGGMKKRVGLARAIATQPEIIFFDEPTTGLDPIMGDVIDRLISKCVKELGATGLSITHDMASAKRISDRMAMLFQGKIIWDGPTSQIEHAGNDYVEQFIHGRAEGPIKMQIQDHFG